MSTATNPIWEMSEADRRYEFARRSAQGASTLLQRAQARRRVKVPIPPVIVAPTDHKPSWRKLQAEVAARYGVTAEDISGKSRVRKIASARHELFWRMKTEFTFSLSQIGKLVGGFDHTTVLNGVRRHAAKIEAEKNEAA